MWCLILIIFITVTRVSVSDIDCAKEESDGMVFSDSSKSKCSAYFQCVDGSPTQCKCIVSYLWDAKRNMCLPEELFVDCAVDVARSFAVESSSASEEEKGNGICYGIPNGDTIPHNESCTKFWVCYEDKVLVSLCPFPFVYDYIRKMCLPRFIANCWADSFTDATTATATSSTSVNLPSFSPTFSPIFTPPTGTSSPTWSISPTWSFTRTPTASSTISSTWSFTRTTRSRTTRSRPTRFTTRSTSTTAAPPSLEVSCPELGVIAVPHNDFCTKYFLCFDGTPVERSCGPNLFWNNDLQQCVLSPKADCTVDSSFCPDQNDPSNIVFVPDPINCAKFYLCYNGRPQALFCDDGLHWDQENEWCAYTEKEYC